MDKGLSLISFFMLIPISASTWSSWSDWSECSRTCGGGASYQTRTCQAVSRKLCIGDEIQYQMCNYQSCLEPEVDLRELQCSVYNNVQYEGNHYSWKPSFDKIDPCALTCKTTIKGHRANEPITAILSPKVLDGTRCNQHSRDMCINGLCRKIGCDNKVDSEKEVDSCGVCGGDGSTCNNQNQPINEILSSEENVIPLDKIFEVYTDNQVAKDYLTTFQNDAADQKHNKITRTGDAYNFLGRSNKFDAVHVFKLGAVEVQLYRWEESDYSECSVTCGQGMQQTTVRCKNMKTNEISPDQFCHLAKPPHRAKTCILRSCHAKWVAGKWSDCSATCGGGLSERNVFCVMAGVGGKKEKTDDTNCLKQRPLSKQSCNTRVCPHWKPGQWSVCSVTCGVGDQYRPSLCKKFVETDICPPNDKPIESQKCHTGVLCSPEKVVGKPQVTIQRRPIILPDPKENKISKEEYNGPIEDNRGGGAFDGDNQLAFEGPDDGRIYSWNNNDSDYIDDLDEEYDRGGDDVDSLYSVDEENNNQITGRDGEFSYNWRDYRGNEVMEMEREEGSGEITGQGVISEDPSYITGSWSQCDVTCGHGHRHRDVTCKALITYSKTIEAVEESLCTGTKPDTTQECIEANCPIRVTDGVPRGSYRWKMSGWQACTATCGGGLKEPIFECVRDDPKIHVTVTKDLCARLSLPKVIKESCNNHPCPAAVYRTEPRWRVMSYGSCSHRCGGGVSQRQVNCVREVGGASGASRELVLPDDMCLDPTPARTKLCNLVNCPPQWATGDFNKCSVTCGQGLMTRNVTCGQITPPAREVALLNEAFCPETSKPQHVQPCERTACTQRAVMRPDSTYYVQLQPRKNIRFVAGGTLVIIPGTILRIRCPVNNYNRSKIVWTKDGDMISRKGRIKRSRRGVLHIRGAERVDAGIYTCHADTLSATTTLRFHTESEALEKYLFREEANARDPEFIDLFRHTIKQTGSNRKEEYTEPYLVKHIGEQLLPLKFITEDWGPCSKSCGGAGLQSRQITCELNLDHYYIVVDDSLCYNKGGDKPLATQDCGFQVCPEWELGVWSSECTDNICLEHGVGAKTRPLYCVSFNGTLLDHRMCDSGSDNKPDTTLSCMMDSCTPTWTTSDWTSCSRSCGGEGIRTRVLQCIWVPNKKAANGKCAALEKPDVMKPCQTPACNDNYCRDESDYCSLVQMLNLCRYSEYRTKCCASCTAIGRGPIRMRRYRLT